MAGKGLFCTLALSIFAAAAQTPEPANEGDVRLFLALRGVNQPSPELLNRATVEYGDRQLVREFLASRKIIVPPEELAAALHAAKTTLAARGNDPDALLRSLGVDDAALERELSLSLAWQRHLNLLLTDEQIRAHWDAHRRRWDGSRPRVAHLFLPYRDGETPADAPATTAALETLRGEITSGRLSFAQAARKHSTAPTAPQGGEVGPIRPRGDLPAAVADAAWTLAVGEVSPPVLSLLGGHLVTPLAWEDGELSFEDARPAVRADLSDRLWKETVHRLRTERR